MKLPITICFMLLLATCKPKSDTNTTTDFTYAFNLPKDSLSFYFPAYSFPGEALDSFKQNWYSSTLYSFKEPVLSKNFIGHSVYRFLWLRSFDRPVVFSLHKKDGQIWLNTKMLDRQPAFYEQFIDGVSKDEQASYFQLGFIIDKNDPDLLVRLADRKADIIYNNNIALSQKEWNEFEQLLAKAKFWTLPSIIDDQSMDGAQWIIEAHLKKKYHFVDSQILYESAYEKAGLFLIQLSGLKEKIY